MFFKNNLPIFVLSASISLSFTLTSPSWASESEKIPLRAIAQPDVPSVIINFKDLARQERRAPPALPIIPKVHVHPYPKEFAPKPSPVELQEKIGAPGEFKIPIYRVSSPSASLSFQALNDNNAAIPPDTHGAVGPNHVITVLNTQVRIQNRSGSTLSTVTLDGFWSSLNNPDTPSTFDPKALYDPYGERWLFTCLANADSNTSSLLMGVSLTSDPTGNWNIFRIDADSTNAIWLDYPSQGFNKDWIVVTANRIKASDGNYDGSNIYVFNKSNLYAGGTSRTLVTGTSLSITLAPAITYDNSLSTLYLIQNYSSGSGQLRLYTLTGSVGSESVQLSTSPSVSAPWAFSATNDTDLAPQLGSSTKIDGGLAWMQNVVYRNGALWCAHIIFLPASSPTRCSVQWWKLNTDGTILQRGRIDDSSGANFYSYPSIAVNKYEEAFIGYSKFSSSQYVSGNYAFRSSSDADNSLRDEVVLKAGEASYVKTFGGAKNRWGDYSNTVVDPTDDSTFWTIQEYAATASGGADRWGTWWGKIVSPSVDTSVSLSVTPANGALNENFTYTATVTNSGSVSVSSATLTDTLPSGLTYVSATPSQGSCSGTTSLSCNLGNLASGANATVTIVGKAAATGSVTNSVTVSAAEAESDSSNNTASATISSALASKTEVRAGDKGYVNPLTGQNASILYQPPESGTIKITIYSLDRTKTIWETSVNVSANTQGSVTWDGKKEGEALPSGIYIVVIEGAGIKEESKIAVVK